VLELAVLGLLKEQPLHGYELKKRLGETLGFLWGVSYGSLYPALRRLEKAGAIEIVAPSAPTSAPVPTGSVSGDLAAARLRSVADRVAGGRRTRKAYRITDRGEAHFVELLLADDERADEEKSFALKLAFCRHLPASDRLSLLERRRDVLRARLEPARRPARATTRSDDRYTRSLVEHRTRSTNRDLEWVEGLIALERGDAPDTEPERESEPTEISEIQSEGAPA
jgi:DNA-binding PadR family transcriptional regulator